MFDLSHVVPVAFWGLGLVQYVLFGCLVVILIAYWWYRKKQM